MILEVTHANQDTPQLSPSPSLSIISKEIEML